MDTRIEKVIKHYWEQMVDQAYFYRGMALKDLDLESSIVLDPAKNPMDELIPLLLEYNEFLLHLIEK